MTTTNIESVRATLTVENFQRTRALLTAPGSDPVALMTRLSGGTMSNDQARKLVDQFLAVDEKSFLAEARAVAKAVEGGILDEKKGKKSNRLELTDEASAMRAGGDWSWGGFIGAVTVGGAAAVAVAATVVTGGLATVIVASVAGAAAGGYLEG